MRWVHGLALALALGGASGCNGDDGMESTVPDDAGAVDTGAPDVIDSGAPAVEAPTADCAAGPIPTFGEVAIFRHCILCHGTAVMGAARYDAPPNVNFDDYASAVLAAERAALYVFHRVMPPSNSGITVTDAEKEQLYLWALCGTPQ
jgi:uncharacterized membrane protein